MKKGYRHKNITMKSLSFNAKKNRSIPRADLKIGVHEAVTSAPGCSKAQVGGERVRCQERRKEWKNERKQGAV